MAKSESRTRSSRSSSRSATTKIPATRAASKQKAAPKPGPKAATNAGGGAGKTAKATSPPSAKGTGKQRTSRAAASAGPGKSGKTQTGKGATAKTAAAKTAAAKTAKTAKASKTAKVIKSVKSAPKANAPKSTASATGTIPAKGSGAKSTKKATTSAATAGAKGGRLSTKATASATATAAGSTAKTSSKRAAKPTAGASAIRTNKRRGAEVPGPRSVAAAAASSLQVDADGYVVIKGRRVRAISTKGILIKKKKKSRGSADAPLEDGMMRTLDPSKLKTRLSATELDRYREMLLERRREILGLVLDMEDEALRSNGGNLSHMPIHMADIGSDTAEQDFTLSMAEKERQMLTEIEAAIGRVDAGTYGVCHATGKPIPKARLEAKPWAKYTIEAARLNEAGRLT